MSLRIAPVTLTQAAAFITDNHRHHPPQGHKFSLGAADGDVLVGGATVGRHLDEGQTLEVTRVCGRRRHPERLLLNFVRRP